MSDERTPPVHLAGEFPFSSEAPAIRFDIDRGACVGIEFPGQATTVRTIHRRDRFGVVADGLDPDAAIDIAAADPTAETIWNALGTALCALAEADCNPAEMVDYLATQKCGLDVEEWREATNSANVRTIRQNAQQARAHLAESRDADQREDRDR